MPQCHNSKTLTEGLEGYLTPSAKALLDKLVLAGLDKDLAFILMEKIMPEIELWEMPDGNKT